MCCARFSSDDAWYRSEVLEVVGSYAGVAFVDYGNSEFVPQSRYVSITAFVPSV